MFIQQGKTNVKYLFIVIIVAIFAGGIIVGVFELMRYSYWWSAVESPKEELCENLCGDGICQEVVCMAVGCPCAETKESCPQDCGAEDETGGTSTGNEKTAGKPPIIEEFSYPYPLSFEEKYTDYSIKFDLTKISLGEKIIQNFSSYSSSFRQGMKVHALTLYFKIKKIGQTGGAPCLINNFRMELNEEGDFEAPLNQMFNANCFWGNQTYFDQEVIFFVPESQKQFTITTGGKSKIFFTITVLNDTTIEIEKTGISE